MFFFEKLSEAAPNTAISSTPASTADLSPLRLGTRAGRFTLISSSCFHLRTALNTSDESPICGTHFGDTKLVASTVWSPAFANF